VKYHHKFTLEEVINGKNSFHNEVKEGLEKKLKITLKIWLRMKNLSKMSSYNSNNNASA
jgi:plasmid maintenance system antidote protein VapI